MTSSIFIRHRWPGLTGVKRGPATAKLAGKMFEGVRCLENPVGRWQ